MSRKTSKEVRYLRARAPPTSYSLNLKELNDLIYEYSSQLSQIDLETLSHFSLESINSFRYIGTFSNNFKDTKLLDIQFVDHQDAIKVMRRKILWPFIKTILLKILFVAVYFLTPLFLELLTTNYQTDHETPEEKKTLELRSWAYAISLLLVMFGDMFLKNKYHWSIIKIKYEFGTVLRYLMYCKFTRIKESQEGTDEKKKEEESNFFNIFNEVDVAMTFFENLNYTWFWTLNLIMTIVILFIKMKTAFPLAMILVLILLKVNMKIADKIGDVYQAILKVKDKRYGITEDVIAGIKSIKYLGWEEIFFDKIMEYRKDEFECIRRIKYLDMYCVMLWGFTSTVIIATTFIIYNFLGYDLEETNIFSDVTYLQMLLFPLNALPWIVGSMKNARTSFKRILTFLNQKEHSKLMIGHKHVRDDVGVILACERARWKFSEEHKTDTSDFSLKNVDLEFRKGSLNFIIGSIGSGKTALLNAILGEMEMHTLKKDFAAESSFEFDDDSLIETVKVEINSNKIEIPNRRIINGKVCYVPQIPWLQNKSIQDNILFGKEYDPVLYKEIISAVAMEQDINTFPGGDSYSVGPDGIHLSGGQKQRVSLARALYQDADVYLLDDILSSVDVNVANIIFQRSIKDFLMRRRKTVIMTISQYKYLPAADRIILMNKGTPIEGQQALDSFLAEIKSDPATSEFSSKFVHEKEDDTATKPAQSSVQENLEASNDLEKKEEGEIKLSTLQLFINAMGKMVFLAIILGGILMQFSRGVFDIWLKDFTYAETTGSTPGFFIISFNFTIFILAAFSIICCAYRAWIFTYGNLLSAKNIFQRLVPNVLYAKMSFFDKNSVGSIIQRFSGDTTSLDDGFPFNWNIMLNNVIIFIRSIWIFTAEIPISIVMLVPSLWVFNYIQKRYRAVSREVKRLESIYSAVVLTHLSETKKGLKVLRASDKEKFMIDEYLEKVNHILAIRCVIDSTALWLALRLRALSFIYSAFMVIVAMIYRYYNNSELNSADFGITILYVVSSPLNFENFLSNMTSTERELIGVERISEYMNVETEIEANKPEDEKKAKPYQVIPEDNEPSQDIEIEMNTFLEITLDQTEKKSILSFKDVSMKYSPNSQNYTLKDINFEVFPKEKIAICGRTGSGKTSILNCLMKLYKVDKGKIFLAGQNIEDIRTKKLRNEIAMIPQSGFLFEATVRDNLDPFNLVKREKIQSILKMGKDIVAKSLKDSKSTSSTNKIFNEDLMIERGAKNLSLGEKQILNLLRVLLRDNQLILLDEATSNIDPITDQIIHELLFEICKEKTLVAVTHRLEYLPRYDKVILVDDGMIVEMGSYSSLMSQSNSKLKNFINENSHF